MGSWCSVTVAKATGKFTCPGGTTTPLIRNVDPGTGVGVGVAVCVGVGVGMGVCVGVGVGMGVCVGVGFGSVVAIGAGVGVGSGVALETRSKTPVLIR